MPTSPASALATAAFEIRCPTCRPSTLACAGSGGKSGQAAPGAPHLASGRSPRVERKVRIAGGFVPARRQAEPPVVCRRCLSRLAFKAGDRANVAAGRLAPGNETDRDAAERCELLEAALARLEPVERAMMATPAHRVTGLRVTAGTPPTPHL
jgi:DNA-directed RNA polymerase subunit RPC12/RpoP